MNRFQKIVLYGTALNVFLLFLFPPYDLVGVGRGAPMFDAFYPMFAVPPNRVLNGDVLYLILFGVLINAAGAWLLLSGSARAPADPRLNEQAVVIVFAFINLAVVLLFPPMEAFPFAQRVTVGTFDGFYFAFGDKSRRSIFVPLLTMEVLFVLINACAFWLAMSIARRAAHVAMQSEPGALTMLSQADQLRARAEQKLQTGGLAKRGQDRRKRNDPNYKGPERRKGPRQRRSA